MSKPAFPLQRNHTASNEGMSLHEYFAGQALVGLLASSRIHEIEPNQMDRVAEVTAELAYKIATAMIDIGACQK